MQTCLPRCASYLLITLQYDTLYGMSKKSAEDTADRRARIAQWQKEGADTAKARKDRNQALIHIGLATLNLIEAEELTAQKLLKHTLETKVDLVERTIETEMERRL